MAPTDPPRAAGTAPVRLACLSRAPFNPYLDLLYDHLLEEGVVRVPGGGLSLRWLLANRGRVDVLHVHWPEGLWRFHRGPAALRPHLSWLKLALFAARVRTARSLGYRIAWTVHQVAPHERLGPGLDLLGARVLAASADVLTAHDETTAEDARARLGRAGRRVEIVPHGSYLGVYPEARGREATRAELGLAPATVVFLAFGELRGYKSVGLLLDAFERAELPDAALVIAGNPKDPEVAASVRAAAARDPRLRLRLGFVAHEDVADLFAASDVAVLSRGDGGTSGSLILALSMARPVVAADTVSYRALTGAGETGWLFAPGDAASLAAALEAAAGPGRDARGASALERARELDWAESARRLARLLHAAVHGA